MSREHQASGTWVVAVPNRAFPANLLGDLAYTRCSYMRSVLVSRVDVATKGLTFSERKKLYRFRIVQLAGLEEEEGGRD
jgi:hypothetical protein